MLIAGFQIPFRFVSTLPFHRMASCQTGVSSPWGLLPTQQVFKFKIADFVRVQDSFGWQEKIWVSYKCGYILVYENNSQ